MYRKAQKAKPAHRGESFFSFSPISARFSYRYLSLEHHRCHRTTDSGDCLLSGTKSQICGTAQLLHRLWGESPALVQVLQQVSLVGLQHGHCVQSHPSLTRCRICSAVQRFLQVPFYTLGHTCRDVMGCRLPKSSSLSCLDSYFRH